MRVLIKDVVAELVGLLPTDDPVFEFGSLQVAGQEGFADLRPLFAGRDYVGCDMRPGPGVDRLLNLNELDLPDACVGTILLMDTLEHVEFPRRAMQELHRVLKPGGWLLMSSVMNFPIHDHPNDYWRFTPEAFRSLLAPFDTAFVSAAGAADFPHTVLGLGVKGALASETTPMITERLAAWERRWYAPARSRWRALMLLVIPPGLLRLGRLLYQRRSTQ